MEKLKRCPFCGDSEKAQAGKSETGGRGRMKEDFKTAILCAVVIMVVVMVLFREV